MEDGGNGFSNGDRGQIGNSSRLGFWEIGTSRFDWTTNPFYSEDTSATTTPVAQQALMHHHQHLQVDNAHTYQYPSIYAGVSHVHPDPHLTCLKLGKRDYFEDGSTLTTPLFQHHLAAAAFPLGKRGKPYGGLVGGGHSSSLTVSVPRCLVEGCHAALFNAKDYHRRHKVCEMHSKAPKVLVLGLEQRFCQQCSRFHVVSEFDDSKRSCRRRLAGHNERRRKSSNEFITKNPSRESKTIGGRFSSLSSSEGRALSLLSSKSGSWVLPSDLSLRSSAALDELIAENRASTFARQIFFNRDTMDELCGAQPGLLPHIPHQQHMPPEQPEWDRFHGSGEHLTLDLMQAPSSASPFGFLSTGRNKIKEDEDECGEIWKSLEGTHMI